MTRLSVIIPHFNDPESLATCLAALEAQTIRPDEIVVADNASPVGEAAVLAAIAGRARLTIVRDKGAGPARNGGVAASTGQILAFTDCDCVPEPGWLENGLAALEGADLVGGAMHVLVADESHLTAAEAFERVFAFDNRDYVLRKAFTVTANLFCRREVFDHVGGFRTGVPEDLEWCHRARDAGYRIAYAADAIVGHPARRTWLELRRKWARLNEEAFGLAAASPNGRARWMVKALAMPFSAIPHLGRVFSSPVLKSPGERLRAVAMLFRLRAWRALDSLRLLKQPPSVRPSAPEPS